MQSSSNSLTKGNDCEERGHVEYHRFHVSIIRRVTTITAGEYHSMDYGTLSPTTSKQYRNYTIQQKVLQRRNNGNPD